MSSEAVKLELIEWLTKLDDDDTLQYLKVVKDLKDNNTDWWNDLPDEHKQGIQRGLSDIDNGKVVPHDEVVKKYGL